MKCSLLHHLDRLALSHDQHCRQKATSNQGSICTSPYCIHVPLWAKLVSTFLLIVDDTIKGSCGLAMGLLSVRPPRIVTVGDELYISDGLCTQQTYSGG